MNGRQEATRARLLQATLEVLRSRGVAQTTSREIASAAGVNLQAITYHFGSKDDLVAQALVHAVRTWVEPARTALTGIAGDPVGGLLAAMAELQQAMSQAHEHFPAYIEALATASRDEAVRDQIVELLAELRTAVAASIRELREAGYIASWVEPEPMAALIVAAGDGFVLHSTLDPAGHATGPAMDQVIRLLLAAAAPEVRDGHDTPN
jgi:AcrR family transcriptional regulator